MKLLYKNKQIMNILRSRIQRHKPIQQLYCGQVHMGKKQKDNTNITRLGADVSNISPVRSSNKIKIKNYHRRQKWKQISQTLGNTIHSNTHIATTKAKQNLNSHYSQFRQSQKQGQNLIQTNNFGVEHSGASSHHNSNSLFNYKSIFQQNFNNISKVILDLNSNSNNSRLNYIKRKCLSMTINTDSFNPSLSNTNQALCLTTRAGRTETPYTISKRISRKQKQKRVFKSAQQSSFNPNNLQTHSTNAYITIAHSIPLHLAQPTRWNPQRNYESSQSHTRRKIKGQRDRIDRTQLEETDKDRGPKEYAKRVCESRSGLLAEDEVFDGKFNFVRNWYRGKANGKKTIKHSVNEGRGIYGPFVDKKESLRPWSGIQNIILIGQDEMNN